MNRMRKYLFLGSAIFFLGSLTCLLAQTQTEGEPQGSRGPAIPKDKGYFVGEIKDGVYWVTDGAYNTMFIVTSEGVIAVDPLPTLGERYLKAIAEVTDKPVTHIIYSHSHTDHIGAAYLFPKGSTIIAQKQTAEILAQRKDPRRPVPTVTFENSYTLTTGGQTLKLVYKGNNHESGNIFVYAPKQKILLLIDVVYPGYMPYKNLGITEDVQGLMQAHRDVLSYEFDTLVAGHVSRLGTRADVTVEMEFLDDLQKTAAKNLSSLTFSAYLQMPDVQTLISRGRSTWDLHNEYEKKLVEQTYQELLPRWKNRLFDTETYLRDNCWEMIEALTVSLPPSPATETSGSVK